EMAISATLIIVLFAWLETEQAIRMSFFVFKSIEIALVITMFFYLFNSYHRQLKAQREKRLSGLKQLEGWKKELKNVNSSLSDKKAEKKTPVQSISDRDKIIFFFEHKSDFLDTDFKIKHLAEAVAIPEYQL